MRIHFDFGARARYLTYFLGSSDHPHVCIGTLFDSPCTQQGLLFDPAKGPEDGIKLEATKITGYNRPINMMDLVYTRRIFLYTEDDLDAWIPEIIAHGEAKGLDVVVRGPSYAAERAGNEVSQAFISHDSRDKDELVRPLVHELAKLGCRVWYDEFSLSVGDSLRESIDRGLKQAPFCVLILSPDFFGNDGWGRAEFDSVFMREILEARNVILPIWHNVTAEDVYNYNARLANKVGLPSTQGVEKLAHRLKAKIDSWTEREARETDA